MGQDLLWILWQLPWSPHVTTMTHEFPTFDDCRGQASGASGAGWPDAAKRFHDLHQCYQAHNEWQKKSSAPMGTVRMDEHPEHPARNQEKLGVKTMSKLGTRVLIHTCKMWLCQDLGSPNMRRIVWGLSTLSVRNHSYCCALPILGSIDNQPPAPLAKRHCHIRSQLMIFRRCILRQVHENLCQATTSKSRSKESPLP
jgi:hypothetical protein